MFEQDPTKTPPACLPPRLPQPPQRWRPVRVSAVPQRCWWTKHPSVHPTELWEDPDLLHLSSQDQFRCSLKAFWSWARETSSAFTSLAVLSSTSTIRKHPNSVSLETKICRGQNKSMSPSQKARVTNLGWNNGNVNAAATRLSQRLKGIEHGLTGIFAQKSHVPIILLWGSSSHVPLYEYR